MRAWPSPRVPSLADTGLGHGRPPRVHDTASGEEVTLDPPGTARMYVCGITPYDATHLGHAATYLAFDLLQRTWRDAGREVAYVQNVTDVDDPLFERAARDGIDWRDLGSREVDLFRSDMTALRVLAPDHLVGVVESMDQIIDVVERLRAAGATYQVGDDLYFDVHADPDFGAIGHLDVPTMLALSAEGGGDPERPGKRDPLDCLLWLAERPGEPGWDSPFGRGRPGWHTECAAISVQYLGTAFDVQGGGTDLVFPHHEMSSSQARRAFAEPRFARAYVHAAMVGLDGEKMSKSKGNLVLVSRLLQQGSSPMAVRLALLAHHYREPWEWTDDDLAAAEKRLERWREAAGAVEAERVLEARQSGLGSLREATWKGSREGLVVEQVRAAMADDLDAPRAVAVIDEWAASGGGGGSVVATACDALLGVAL